MCVGNNNASFLEHYLSSQLNVLWSCAAACIKEAPDASDPLDMASPEYEQSKAARAFAQYHYLGNLDPLNVESISDLFFSVAFDEPSLHFVCKHSVVFTLNVNEAHLNLDYSEAFAADPQLNP